MFRDNHCPPTTCPVDVDPHLLRGLLTKRRVPQSSTMLQTSKPRATVCQRTLSELEAPMNNPLHSPQGGEGLYFQASGNKTSVIGAPRYIHICVILCIHETN